MATSRKKTSDKVAGESGNASGNGEVKTYSSAEIAGRLVLTNKRDGMVVSKLLGKAVRIEGNTHTLEQWETLCKKYLKGVVYTFVK